MCTPSSIKLYFVAINAVKCMFAIYLLSLGAYVLSQPAFRQAYGTYFEGTGAGIVILGLLEPMNAAIGHAGSSRHNKFLLLMNAIFDAILLCTHLGLGMTMLEAAQVNYITPQFDNELRADCLTRLSDPANEDSCAEYLSSDRFAGMRLAWTAFYLDDDPNVFREMKVLARSGGCCGFGKYESCVVDTQPYPPDKSTEGISGEFSSQRVKCGMQPSWYVMSDYCVMEVSDPRMGCFCELPIGDCCTDTGDEYKGCASELEVYLGNAIEGHGIVLLGMMFLQVINIIVACCYCMKRRSDDVMPDYLAKEPWDPYGPDGIMKTDQGGFGDEEGAAPPQVD